MNGQSVSLTASEKGAIYYTIDSTEPTVSSPQYSGPISISADATVKALAVDSVGNVGPVASETYTICNGSNMSITGVVQDATLDKKGMAMVVITLNSGHSATTDTSGNYSFTNLPRGNYRVDSITTVTPGYMTYQKELELCKTNITQDIVLTRPDTVFGFSSNSGYGDGPVNTATGNYVYANADLEIPGLGTPFSFVRAYNSQDSTDGPFGIGWTYSYNVSLAVSTDNEVAVRLGDGKAETWTPDGSGGYKPRYGVFSSLVKNGDNTFTITQKNQTVYNFDLANKLASIVDSHGNTMTFTYDGANLASITDTVGRVVTLSYDASGHITRLLGPTARSVNYVYDANGDMVTVIDLGGNSTTFTYDTNHQILTVTDPIGNVVVSNSYDELRRVISSQRDAIGAETLYSYDGVSRVTQVTDPYGNTSYHYYNDYLQLIKEVDAHDNLAIYVYDDRGNVVTVVDKRGNQTTYTYDVNGNVESKTEPLGRVTSAVYDVNNNPTSKTDANNNTTLYTYDPVSGDLTSEQDSLGTITNYTYDQHGQILTETYAVGTSLETVALFEYDPVAGDLVKVEDAQGNQSTFTYDGVGRKLTENHPLSRSTAYDYDAMDRLVSITDAFGNITAFTYDANGNKLQHIDAKGNITSFTYDAKNRLLSRTSPMGRTESYKYDLMDRRIAVTDPMGRITQTVYDALGNVIQQIDALGNSIRHRYDANGNKVETVDPKGNITTFVYNELNQLTSTTEPMGITESYTYDANGNRLKITDSQGKNTTYTYNERDRLNTVTDHLGNLVINDYDLLGRLVRVTDAKNGQTDFAYDNLGRLIQVSDAEGGIVTASYDALGNRLTVTDARQNITEYTYDILNRLVTEKDPLNNTVVMEYDKLGNMVSLTDASNEKTTYSYDNDNRLVSLIYPGASSTVTYTYDSNGNRLSVVDSMGTTSLEYNELNRLVSVTDPFNQTVGYTYDPNGNRNSTKYPGNRAVYYFFDGQDRLERVEEWGGVATTYQYDNVGRLAVQTMGNGATVTYTYDNANRLTNKTDRKADGSVLASYDFTLDANGNRTGLEMNQPLVPMVESENSTYTHDAANQLTSGGGKTFEHDQEGNRTRQTEGSAIVDYTYNDDDLLTGVADGTNVYEYRYNSAGHRLASIMNSTETRYLLDINGGMEYVLAEMDAANNPLRYYIYGDGLLYSVDAATGERLFYHYDPIGSTVAITDKDGNITDQYAYLPFGESVGSGHEETIPFTYVGKFGVMQEQNGLYFMRARFYDPVTKRFLSKDPVKGDISNSQTLSPYSYGYGNPISYVDPEGEFGILATYLAVTGTAGGVMNTISYISDNGGNLSVAGVAKSFGSGFVGGVVAGVGGAVTALTGNPYATAVGAASGVAITKALNRGGRRPTSFEIASDSLDFACAISGATACDYASIGGLANQNVTSGSKNITSSDEAVDSILNSMTDEIIEGSGDQAEILTKSTTEIANGNQQAERKERTWAEIRERTRQRRENDRKRAEQNRLDRKLRKRARAEARKERREERERMKREKERFKALLYAKLTSEYSKHHVLIQDLSEKPSFNSGNRNRVGVYGN